ncbi:CehA/McbA family metallohydrolase [Myxococcota bacterium]|nr:CehA/McbA family metallohydrolase [Myxococcota bacterium]
MTRRSAPPPLTALLLALAAGAGCTAEPPAGDDDATPDDDAPLDLAEALGPGEVRAGVVADASALFEGVAAEGRVGDVKVYNACARFVVRGVRPGPYFVPGGGGITDADAARPEGQAGRDAIDDHFTFVGVGRLFTADTVEVTADGADGGPASVRAVGHGEPMTLLLAALGSWDFIPDWDLRIEQTYTLAADSCTLRIDTTVTNDEPSAVTLAVGDGVLLSDDIMELYLPGAGLSGDLGADASFLGAVGRRNEQALWMWPGEGSFDTSFAAVMAAIGPIVVGMGETLTLQPGESASSTRFLGVGADPAVLEAERREARGEGAAALAGVVRDGTGAPVAGARVHLLGPEGEHLGLAFSGTDGSYRLVAAPGPARVVATGDGIGEQVDVPASWAPWAPWALPEVNARAHGQGATTPPPFADGYGTSPAVEVVLEAGAEAAADLALGAPGWLAIRTVDGDGADVPALVRVEHPGGIDPTPPDGVLEPGNPDGAERVLWTRGAGAARVPVPPGTYDLLAHRGQRSEYDRREGIAVAEGQEVEVTLTVPSAYEVPGWLSMDSHLHAAPSVDGSLPMEDRVVVTAATGVDVHVATDHDAVVDYRPVVTDLDLDPWLASVVAQEVSPVLLGHFTLYPIEEDVEARAHGAVGWFWEPMTTSDLFAEMRERGGPDAVVQVAHGLNQSGMFHFADFDAITGTAGSPDHLGEDFQAMEVLPGGDGFAWDEYLPVWYALLRNGGRVAPVASSDSHGRRGGTPGYAATFVRVGVDRPDEMLPADLGRAVRAGEVVATTGPFVDLTVTAGGASAGPGGQLAGDAVDVEVTAYAPSWMQLDEVRLLRNGEAIATEVVDPGALASPVAAHATFHDEPGADAFYTVEVRGTARDLFPVYPGRLPFAVTGAVWVAVGD